MQVPTPLQSPREFPVAVAVAVQTHIHFIPGVPTDQKRHSLARRHARFTTNALNPCNSPCDFSFPARVWGPRQRNRGPERPDLNERQIVHENGRVKTMYVWRRGVAFAGVATPK